ncbi:MAG: outer membrane protein TolC [Myxococcota bacterium]
MRFAMNMTLRFVIYSFVFALLLAFCPSVAMGNMPPGESANKQGPPLTLDDCIRLATTQNPMVRAAQHGVWGIEERQREAWYSAWLPTLKLRTMLTVIPPQGDIAPTEGPDLSEWNVWSRSDLEIVWPLYTFGKLSAVTDMAQHGVDAANAILAEARAELRFQVHKAWYALQLSKALGQVIAEGEKEVDKARERLDEMEEDDDDEYDQADHQRLKIYAARVRKMVLGNNRIARMARLGLRLAMNLPDGAPLNLPEANALEAIEIELEDLDKLVRRAGEQRPEILAQRKRIEIANSNVDLKFAEYFPDIFLAANVTAATSTVSNPNSENVFTGGVFNTVGGGGAIGLRLTLDYPQKITRYRRAQAELAQAESELAGRLLLLRIKLEETWLEARDNKEMMELQRIAMRAAKSLLTQAVINYKDGFDPDATFGKVLGASVQYHTAKSEWLTAIHAFNMSVARLSRVVGIDLTKREEQP